nr:unnamed protein product [Digitaria exilis]
MCSAAAADGARRTAAAAARGEGARPRKAWRMCGRRRAADASAFAIQSSAACGGAGPGAVDGVVEEAEEGVVRR